MAGGSNAKCGITELTIFVLALVAGTGCSLTSKVGHRCVALACALSDRTWCCDRSF